MNSHCMIEGCYLDYEHSHRASTTNDQPERSERHIVRCICSQQHVDRNCEIHFPQPSQSEREALISLLDKFIIKFYSAKKNDRLFGAAHLYFTERDLQAQKIDGAFCKQLADAILAAYEVRRK